MAQLWADFLEVARPSTDWSGAGFVLTLDPGETTGWSLWEEGLLLDCGQWDTGREPAATADAIHALAAVYYLETIVYEEYRIRGNKAQQHIGSEVFTIQHIGAIKVAADELDVRLVKQTAGQVKQSTTDVKLRRWGLYQTNQRHANDAIRHGVHYHLFYYGRKEPKRMQDEDLEDSHGKEPRHNTDRVDQG